MNVFDAAYGNNESSGEDSSGSDTEPSKNGHFTEEPLEQVGKPNVYHSCTVVQQL